MNKIYCKVGNVELSERESYDIYNNKKYICTSTAIYQPHFSQAQNQIYFTKIASYKGIAKRGRFYTLNAKEINDIIGYDYLREV